MNSQLQKNEGWLYGLAFLIAIGLRLVQLGALPLGDSEAASALQALGIAQGLKTALGPQPAYILLTAPLFLIYGLVDATVDTTVCKGKILMQGKKILALDEERIAARSRELAPQMWQRLAKL